LFRKIVPTSQLEDIAVEIGAIRRHSVRFLAWISKQERFLRLI
jgi:hypothetical protein